MTNCEDSIEPIAVYLGLGSNMGDREANLREAIARIRTLGLDVVRESSIYETQPVGVTDQPWFLNQVIETRMIVGLTSAGGPVLSGPGTTAMIRAEALLSELLEIEQAMGRERTIANGPRVIDIDLLLFGDAIIGHSRQVEDQAFRGRTEVLAPHPRMHLRRFVLAPLCEIAPEVVHPLLRTSCREILASVDDPSAVRLYEKGGKLG